MLDFFGGYDVSEFFIEFCLFFFSDVMLVKELLLDVVYCIVDYLYVGNVDVW